MFGLCKNVELVPVWLGIVAYITCNSGLEWNSDSGVSARIHWNSVFLNLFRKKKWGTF